MAYRTKVLSKKSIAPNVVELAVELVEPGKIVFTAGQFMQFEIGTQLRSYSIVSAPGDRKDLSFCIELVKEGLGSEFVRNLKEGDLISMKGPFGVFTLKDFQKSAAFVATGVGVAPFKPMIEEALKYGYKKPVLLLFGIRTQDDAIYFEDFHKLSSEYKNFEFIPILSKPNGKEWNGETGRVTLFLETNYEKYKDRLFYLCGGMQMIKDARGVLLEKGHSPLNIKLEIFS